MTTQETQQPFEVLFLAAGFGTRMGNAPKGLIHYKDSTILEELIKHLGDKSIFGMTGFTLMTNALFASEYMKILDKYSRQFNFHFLNNGVLTAEEQKQRGALLDLDSALQASYLRGKPTLVLSVDTVFEDPQFFQRFLEIIAKHPNDFVTVMRRFDSPQHVAGRLGCAVLSGDKVTSFVEKPKNPPATKDVSGEFWLGAVPFYYYSPQAIKLLHEYVIDPTTNHDAPGNIIPFLLKRGFPVYASVTTGMTLDVGTKEDADRLKKQSA